MDQFTRKEKAMVEVPIEKTVSHLSAEEQIAEGVRAIAYAGKHPNPCERELGGARIIMQGIRKMLDLDLSHRLAVRIEKLEAAVFGPAVIFVSDKLTQEQINGLQSSRGDLRVDENKQPDQPAPQPAATGDEPPTILTLRKAISDAVSKTQGGHVEVRYRLALVNEMFSAVEPLFDRLRSDLAATTQRGDRLQKELDAAVEHHARCRDGIDRKLGEPRRDSGSIWDSMEAAIDELKQRAEQAERERDDLRFANEKNFQRRNEQVNNAAALVQQAESDRDAARAECERLRKMNSWASQMRAKGNLVIASFSKEWRVSAWYDSNWHESYSESITDALLAAHASAEKGATSDG